MERGETIFDGEPDARQSEAPTVAPENSLFRKRYRKLSEAEVALHDKIKEKADELAGLFLEIPCAGAIDNGTESVLPNGKTIFINKNQHVYFAIEHLEDAVYRAVKALTA